MAWLEVALAAAAAAGLLLVAARHLWALRWSLSRDRASALPLPRGSMGWPFFGETLHWLIQQGSHFHSSRRQRYGAVFKTHLLGKPVVRVSGAENVRKILLGEHSLVSAQWPLSTQILLGSHTLLNARAETHRQKRKILARVFSRAALEVYLPRIQRLVSWELRGWCRRPGPIAVYASAKALTFRIAARILLGLRLEEEQFEELSGAFEQLVENLFCLPLNVPFSGLRKESAIELIFAAFFTTASATTSMILLLLKHPLVIKKIQQELASNGFTGQCQCFAAEDFLTKYPSGQKTLPAREKENQDGDSRLGREEGQETKMEEKGPNINITAKVSQEIVHGTTNGPSSLSSLEETGRFFSSLERSEYCCHPYLTLEKLNRLRYLDCVIKEVLRLLPPVSGGYRTALQTFELDGYQIPKGWSVMYSIRDTHETAGIYQSPPDTFDPERFWVSPEDRENHKTSASLRFHYIPFGGGVRNCIGKELAQVILKMLAIELVSTASWELATTHFPKMQTVPIVHPVDGLQLYFHSLKAGHESSGAGKDA
ncbi:hypothetical protein Chor_013909 [Crotalus horridus]